MKKLLTNRGRKIGRAAPVPDWPKSAVRIGFGLIWLVDAAFKWSPDFRTGLLGMVKGAGDGQPSWLHGFFHFWRVTNQPHPYVWAYGVAAIQTLIAFADLRLRTQGHLHRDDLHGTRDLGDRGGLRRPIQRDLHRHRSGRDVRSRRARIAGPAAAVRPESVQRRLLDRAARELWHWVAEFGAHWHPAPGDKEPVPLAPPRPTPVAPPAVPLASSH